MPVCYGSSTSHTLVFILKHKSNLVAENNFKWIHVFKTSIFKSVNLSEKSKLFFNQFLFQVNGLSLQILTLARYILELSIHEALFVDVPASKIAAACLCLALKMKDEGEWDGNFVYHTTYKEKDLKQLMRDLNDMVETAPKNKLQTVRTKYSHPVFHEVAKIPALDAVLL